MNNRAAKQVRRSIRNQLRELNKQLPAVEYVETGKHMVTNINDVRRGNMVSDPVKLSQHCERKFFKNAKFNFKRNAAILRASGKQFDVATVIAVSV